MSSAQNLTTFLTPLADRKPRSVNAIDVRDLTSYADTLIIIEASSKRQVTAIAEHMISKLKNQKITPLGMEGVKEGEWTLLDYGDVIIHIFESQTKQMYDLEGFWADAPRIDISQFGLTPPEQEDFDDD